MNPWIQTHTGVAFDLIEPTPDMINIGDIAHALSHLCRYTGHSAGFYSVAEHSIEVAKLALEMRNPNSAQVDLAAVATDMFGARFGEVARRAMQDMALPLARWGLLHDAAEAYVGDVSAPLKSQLPAYKRIENRVALAVFSRFGLDHDRVPAAIKHLDLVMLMSEAKTMLGPAPRKWRIDAEPLPQWKPRYLNPAQAKAEFLAMYHELFEGES